MASGSPTPSTADELRAAAERALNRGAYPEAARLCSRLVDVAPEYADGWFLSGMVAAAGFRIGQALQLVDRALALRPDCAEYLAQKAKLHVLLQQPAAAAAAADRAMPLPGKSALTLDTLGVAYTKVGAYAEARAALTEAVSLAPRQAQFHFNLASVEQFLGHLDAARHHYQTSIDLEPRFYRAHWALSELTKTADVPAHVQRLESLLAQQGLNADDELYLCHALANEYEKLGDFDGAFRTLERGKLRRIGQISYSIKRDERIFEALMTAFAEPAAEPPPGDAPGAEAIFVVGMPRTGTTLVESILASHPLVTALGETQDFALAVKRASRTDSRLVLDEEVVPAARAADLRAIGADYLQRIGARLPEGGRFVDKMPLNFLYLGFILHALPAAKVICLRRHPLDTCISNYRQLFAINFSYYNYHYDLRSTAQYYVLFDRLMRHWRALFGERFIEMEYEALTAEPETEIRRMLGYLELPWDPACLTFHASDRAVATASTTQVRQPMYRSAVGRWQRYRPQLQEVMALLQREGIRWAE